MYYLIVVRLMAECGNTVPPQGTLGNDDIHINVAKPIQILWSQYVYIF